MISRRQYQGSASGKNGIYSLLYSTDFPAFPDLREEMMLLQEILDRFYTLFEVDDGDEHLEPVREDPGPGPQTMKVWRLRTSRAKVWRASLLP